MYDDEYFFAKLIKMGHYKTNKPINCQLTDSKKQNRQPPLRSNQWLSSTLVRPAYPKNNI